MLDLPIQAHLLTERYDSGSYRIPTGFGKPELEFSQFFFDMGKDGILVWIRKSYCKYTVENKVKSTVIT